MVLPLKSPIDLAGECRIAAEAEIVIDVKIAVVAPCAEIAGWTGKPPVPFHSPSVVIEVFAVLGSNQGNHSQKEKCDDKSFSGTLNWKEHLGRTPHM